MSNIKKESRSDKLLKNTLILSIGSFLPKFAAFITLPLLTGVLTKEEYGTYDLVTVLVSLLLPSLTCQIKVSAFRYLIDCRDDEYEQKRIITNIFAFTVVVSSISLLIMTLVLWKISLIGRLCIALYFFADIMVNTLRQVARGIGRSKAYSVSAIVSALGKIVFAVLFVKIFSLGIIGAILALSLASVLSFIYLFITLNAFKLVDYKTLDKTFVKKLLGYSWPLVPNELSLWIMRVSDRLIVVFFLGAAKNAIYSVANKIPSIVTLAQSAITLAWQENASIASKDSDASNYYSSMFRVIHSFQAGFMGLVVSSTPILFKLFVRGDYSESYPHIPILCLAIFYSSIATYLGGIYVAYKETKSIGVTTIAAALINIIVNVSLIKIIGIYAASISTLVAFMVLMLYRMRNVRRIVDIKYDYKNIVIVNVIMISECIIGSINNVFFNLFNFVYASIVFILLNKSTIVIINAKIKKRLKRN